MPERPLGKPRVKAWKPKVKTGCKTCRIRHLKCDETQPACLRCIKMGFQCDGYPRDEPSPIGNRVLVPKIIKELEHDSITALSSPELALTTYRFDDQREFLSLQTFHERSMFHLVGTGSADLWDRIVLQACAYEGSIRNVVVAIGALSFTFTTHKTGDEIEHGGKGGTVRQTAEQHQFALQNYGRAITQMRRGIEKGKYSLRTTLICCLLAACFELIEGRDNAASIHARFGLGMIDQRKPAIEQGGTVGELQSFEESLGDVFLKLDRISKPFALRTLFGIQDEVQDDLDSKIPEVFRTCEDARKAWNRSIKSIYLSLNLGHNDTCGLGGSVQNRAISHTPSRDIEVFQEDEGHQIDLRFSRLQLDQAYPHHETDQLLAWHTAFQPLFNTSRISSDIHFRAQAAFLKVRHHINFIALTCAQSDNEMLYDSLHHIFKEIIELSEEILAEQKNLKSNNPVFKFDTGVVGFLWITASKCRDSAIRWKAVQLLKECPRREGRWHCGLVANGAETIVRVEEMGGNGDVVPEMARIKAEGVIFDLVSRKGTLIYSKLPRLGEMGFDSGDRIQEKVEILW